MNKKEISAVLEEIGNILQIKGENPFKTRAYHNGARILDGLQEDLAALVEAGTLSKVQGIGPALAEKITEMVQTGRSSYHEKVRKSIPPGLLDMLRVQGMGPKKVKMLYDKLDISSLRDLEKACKADKLSKLAGFGAKTQENILKGLAHLKKTSGKFRVDHAMAEAQRLLEIVSAHKGVRQAVIGGSLRRCKEVVHDIDILASCAKPEKLMQAFVQVPGVERVLAHGHTKSSVQLESGIQADLRVVADKEFPFALHYFTGSKEHNIAMRGLAQDRGMKLNEYGLFHIKGKKEIPIPCKDETALFKKLGLDYIAPELREDQGEIEAAAAARLPKLITRKQMRGVFHVHSTYSDGVAPLEEMIRKAVEMGLEYVGISDHSPAAHYANGLSPERLKKQHAEIDQLARKYPTIRILKGSEVDILADGALDYDEASLDSLDFVIASVHSRFNLPEKEQTARIVRAMKNKHTTMLGHPTGALVLSRPPYGLDLRRVIDVAADHGKMIEINANPQRLDLDWRMCRYAKEKGVLLSINPDAHSVEGMDDLDFGVGIARKGWLEKADVFNTWSTKDMLKALGAA